MKYHIKRELRLRACKAIMGLKRICSVPQHHALLSAVQYKILSASAVSSY